MEPERSSLAEEVRQKEPLNAVFTASNVKTGDDGSGPSGLGRGSGLRTVDPLVAELIDRETRRQTEKLILIPSETVPHPAVLEALASPFTSLYAEGYAPERLREATLDDLAPIDTQLAIHRESGNRRFYQGAELADLVESVAERRTAECFATDACPADRIRVNVQPLSGSVANLAVYEALLQPDDVLMAMELTEGGHLTHGSPYSVSGRRYRTVWYGTDPRTQRIDYDEVRDLAFEVRPKVLVGGFSSYPWAPDWARLREIADEVSAYLLADIAHSAGLVIGGVYPNPLGIADAVTLTTHKTLCGPRAGVILSTEEKIARRIDRAVFPGLQGGPHVNKIAAVAVAMKLARRDRFRTLQRRIVENARALASALEDRGLALAYGGTDTHLLLIDLRPLGLQATLAARALDRVGIVCNQNVIPGDRNGADPSGLRFGTPWASQRGMGPREMDDLAGIIASVLFALAESGSGASGDSQTSSLRRQLDRAAEDVRALVDRYPGVG